MTGLSIALVNLKPGTGKTTSAVWLAHVFAEAGNTVLLVDADPSGSALEWSDFAAMDPRLPPQAAFPFRIVALPSRDLHRRVPEVARPDDVVIIDAPQLEDHAGIARSALRYADEILIPCAPSPIEINRTTPVRDEITDAGAARDRPARAAVLLNRCVTRANSTGYARAALEGLGYDVLGTAVPRLEVYAQSFGIPIPVRGRGVWGRVARDLAGRCVPLRSAASLPGRRSSAKCGSQPRRGVHCRVSRPGCAREILQPDARAPRPPAAGYLTSAVVLAGSLSPGRQFSDAPRQATGLPVRKSVDDLCKDAVNLCTTWG